MSSTLIKMEQRRIQRLIDLAASGEIIEKPPTLSVAVRKASIYCYESKYEDGKRIGKTYLGTADSKAVRNHCRKRFRVELLQRLKKNNELLEKLINEYCSLNPDAVVASLPTAYKKVSSEMFVDLRYEELKAWANEDYQINTAPYPKAKHFAKDGRRVRSKGECIIYNLLLETGIPFRYDSVMEFVDSGGRIKKLSPDFLIQCYDGTIVIIEHLGLIGDVRYAIDFGEKCYWFSCKDFVLGKNFFVTSDDREGGTDSASIMSTISLVEALFWGC